MARLTFLCDPQRRHGRDNLLHSLFDHITCFNIKLHLWELQLRKGGSAHLPRLSECVATDTVKQASAVADLRTELRNRFTDFKSNEKSMIFLYNFHCTYRRCSWQQGNGNNWFTMQRWPKRKYKNSGLLDLYPKHTDTNTSPAIHSYAMKMVSVFEIKYLCKRLF